MVVSPKLPKIRGPNGFGDPNLVAASVISHGKQLNCRIWFEPSLRAKRAPTFLYRKGGESGGLSESPTGWPRQASQSQDGRRTCYSALLTLMLTQVSRKN